VSGEILRDGGTEPERLRPLVSEEVYETEAEGFATLASNGWVALGGSELVTFSLQQHNPGEPGVAEVVGYACVSVANSDIVDSGGESKVDPARPLNIDFEIVFISTKEGVLVVDRKDVWNGGSACSLD